MASTATPSPLMVLSIRTLEHQTRPVTIPRDASVLDLKHAVQGEFHVESNRQRLIFQGKMMKDGQSLTEYANLDTGKVVHLVVRPPDVPQNPQNDEPRPHHQHHHPQHPNTRAFARGIPLPRFPFGRSPLPMVEGYTFITLDVGGDRAAQPFSSLMDGLSSSLFPPSSPPPRPPSSTQSRTHSHDPTTRATTIPSQSSSSSSSNNNNSNSSSTAHDNHRRPPFEFNLRPRISATDFGFLNAASDARLSPSSQLPASVEVRLMRTMSCIRNVRTILDTPPDQSITGIATTSTTSPEQAREIRARLRSYGNSQPAAVGMVLDELATLMTDIVPRLRDMTEALRARDQAPENEGNTDIYRRVLRTARVIQGMSLISHFLGSVLAAVEVSPRSSSVTHTDNRDERTRLRSGTTTMATQTDRLRVHPWSGGLPGQPSDSQRLRTPTHGENSQQQAQQRGTKRPSNEDHGACSQQKKGKGREGDT